MAKRIGFGIVFSVFVANLCIMGQAFASDTVGSFDWELSNVVDMQNKPVQLNQTVLSLDVDLGFYFLNFYGTLCPQNSTDCNPVSGSGYIKSFDNASGVATVRMDINVGTKVYRISLRSDTLGGTFVIYDKDGAAEYAGSLDLLYMY